MCPYTNFEVDLLLGEISNGPFIKTRNSEIHTQEDQKKTFKCLKDAIDNLVNFLKQNIANFRVEMISDLMFFGISAYGIVFKYCNF